MSDNSEVDSPGDTPDTPRLDPRTQTPLTLADVERRLDGIYSWAEDWNRSERVREGWKVSPGSALAGDDKITFPFNTSQAAHASLNVSLDHLHALTFASAEHRTLHTHAPLSLARAAIESAATAFWLVSPPRRRDRVLRTLRLHATDLHDAVNAKDDLAGELRVSPDERLAELEAKTVAAGVVAANPLKQLKATDIVREVDGALAGRVTTGALGAWRLFSGIAHARPWASAAFLDREVIPIDEKISRVRRINTPARILQAASIAQEVFTLAADTYNDRARSPLDDAG